MRNSCLVGVLLLILGCAKAGSAPVQTSPPPAVEDSAIWPWPGAHETVPFPHVKRFFATFPKDGTKLELFQFDFAKNRNLRFEIYDQDQDDSTPFDDKADYYPNGVGQVTKHLNETGHGRVLLAWNGLFFGYRNVPNGPQHGWATHIGPVVLKGRMHYNVGQHRWTFGVKYGPHRQPQFKVAYLPDVHSLASRFDFAADGAECLLLNGKPLRLNTDGPEAAGAIAMVDEIKTSRTSIGWSKDSRYLWVLIVDEPDSETASVNALRRGLPQTGGWSVSDLQRFWVRFGAYNAINSDGGSETQRTWLLPNGSYDLLAPQLSKGPRHVVLAPGFKSAPDDGSLMTFFVSER